MAGEKKGQCVKCKKGKNRKLNAQGICYFDCVPGDKNRQNGDARRVDGARQDDIPRGGPPLTQRSRSNSHTSISSNTEDEVPCGHCKELIEEDGDSMQCEACSKWFHLAPCCNMSNEQYRVLSSHGLKDVVRWFCTKCDANVMSSNKNLATVNNRLAALEDSKNIENMIERKVQQYFEEKAEADKRKQNVIIHGIPEPPSEVEDDEGETRDSTPEERKQHDLTKVASLGNADQHLKVEANDIESIYRIGAKRNDGKARLVCVKLRQPEVKKRLLENAKKLRNSQTNWHKKVYINPDLTKQQREKSQQARQELARRSQNGEDNLVIRNNQVVKRQQRNTGNVGNGNRPT